MAWTDADLQKVRDAIKSGVRSITFADGRKTEYQSLDHLLKAEEVISAALTIQAQTLTRARRFRTPYYKSGL
ncbi:hypothetical protein ACFB49_42610 [Sphingomonas sp. DBB INV C78]|uniref:phage head-tail joining protein n=1 Tax=Sphingomonas sp. DBB INV C78 TaxID=3349434 RepID=UPI0036D2E6D2